MNILVRSSTASEMLGTAQRRFLTSERPKFTLSTAANELLSFRIMWDRKGLWLYTTSCRLPSPARPRCYSVIMFNYSPGWSPYPHWLKVVSYNPPIVTESKKRWIDLWRSSPVLNLSASLRGHFDLWSILVIHFPLETFSRSCWTALSSRLYPSTASKIVQVLAGSAPVAWIKYDNFRRLTFVVFSSCCNCETALEASWTHVA